MNWEELEAQAHNVSMEIWRDFDVWLDFIGSDNGWETQADRANLDGLTADTLDELIATVYGILHEVP